MKQANAHLTARRAQKAALLPQVVQLAREGLSYQKIADQVGVAKSTVCQWLRGRPLEQAAKTLGTPRMTAKLAKRYESLYQKAIREWTRSKTDREIRTVETIAPAGCSPTTKTIIRAEPRTANAACLGKALAAMKAMEGLHYREQRRLEIAAEFGSRPSAMDRAADEDDQDALHDEESLTPCEENTDQTTERSISRSEPVAGSQADAAITTARSVNAGTASSPPPRRKSFALNTLGLSDDRSSTVFRSATLPNDVAQKSGRAKGRNKAPKRLPHEGVSGGHHARSHAAEQAAARGGSSTTLMREIERAFGDRNGLHKALPRDGGICADRRLTFDGGAASQTD